MFAVPCNHWFGNHPFRESLEVSEAIESHERQDLSCLNDEGVLAIRPRTLVRTRCNRHSPAPGLKSTAPAERSQEQHYALTAVMRESKMIKFVKKLKASVWIQAQDITARLQEVVYKGHRVEVCKAPVGRPILASSNAAELAETSTPVLVVRTRTRGIDDGRVKNARFGTSSVLDIACADLGSSAGSLTLSKVYNCSRSFARSVRRVLAHVFCGYSLYTLKLLSPANRW